MAIIPRSRTSFDPILGSKFLDTREVGLGGAFASTFERDFTANSLRQVVKIRKAGERAAPTDLIDPSILNEENKDLGLTFDAPMSRDQVGYLREDAIKEQMLNTVGSMGTQGALGFSAQLAGGLAGSIADPIDLASMFIPIVGPAGRAQLAARVGTRASRVATGAIEGTVGTALTEPLYYGASEFLQREYGFNDALFTIGIGGLFGAGVGGIRNAFNIRRDRMTKQLENVRRAEETIAKIQRGELDATADPTRGLSPEERVLLLSENERRQIVLHSALSAAADGKPIDLEGIARLEDADARGLRKERVRLYKDFTRKGGFDPTTSRALAEVAVNFHLALVEVYPQMGLSRVREFMPEALKTVFSKERMNAPDGSEVRGAFREPGVFGSTAGRMTFFPGAKADTALHELGHYVDFVLEAASREPDAPTQLRNDVAALRKWKERQAGALARFPGDPEHGMREAFADAYMLHKAEGVAPNQAMARVFKFFEKILRAIREAADKLGIEMTPDIRDVLNRYGGSGFDWNKVMRQAADDPKARAAAEAKIAREGIRDLGHDLTPEDLPKIEQDTETLAGIVDRPALDRDAPEIAQAIDETTEDVARVKQEMAAEAAPERAEEPGQSLPADRFADVDMEAAVRALDDAAPEIEARLNEEAVAGSGAYNALSPEAKTMVDDMNARRVTEAEIAAMVDEGTARAEDFTAAMRYLDEEFGLFQTARESFSKFLTRLGLKRAPAPGTPEFNRSLSETKVVDNDGAPLLIYHASPKKFQHFRQSKIGSTTDQGLSGAGFYFTNAVDNALGYGRYLYSAYVNLKNPFYKNHDASFESQVKALDDLLQAAPSLKTLAEKMRAERASDELSAVKELTFGDFTMRFPREVRKALLRSGYDGIVPGSRDAGIRLGEDIAEEVVVFKASSIFVKERLDSELNALFQTAREDIPAPLEGFESTATRALRSIERGSKDSAKPSGTAAEWRKELEAKGAKPKELAAMGWDAEFAGKGKISREEVVSFIERQQPELEVKVLGAGAPSEGVRMSTRPEDMTPVREVGTERAQDYHRVDTDAGAYSVVSRGDRWAIFAGTPDDGNLSHINIASNAAEVEHMIAGHAAARIQSRASGTRFSSYAIPGGEPGTYREVLIRDRGLETDPKRGETAAKNRDRLRVVNEDLRRALGERDEARRNEADTDEIDARIEQLDAEKVRLSTKTAAGPVYTSPHFHDQEIAHLRVDDRQVEGVGRTMFVNEVQSDLHQKGRRQGYLSDGDAARRQEVESEINRLGEANSAATRRADDIRGTIRTEMGQETRKHVPVQAIENFVSLYRDVIRAEIRFKSDDVDGGISRIRREYGDEAADGVQRVIDRANQDGRLAELREIDQQTAANVEATRPLQSERDGLMAKIPPAALPDDWQNLAVKQALRMAAREGYDAVAFARSDQIAPVVGESAGKLSTLYDKTIPKFLKKYVKGLGGEVEARSVVDDSANPLIRITSEMRKALSDAPQPLYQTAREGLGEAEPFRLEVARRGDMGGMSVQVMDGAKAVASIQVDPVAGSGNGYRLDASVDPSMQQGALSVRLMGLIDDALEARGLRLLPSQADDMTTKGFLHFYGRDPMSVAFDPRAVALAEFELAGSGGRVTMKALDDSGAPVSGLNKGEVSAWRLLEKDESGRVIRSEDVDSAAYEGRTPSYEDVVGGRGDPDALPFNVVAAKLSRDLATIERAGRELDEAAAASDLRVDDSGLAFGADSPIDLITANLRERIGDDFGEAEIARLDEALSSEATIGEIRRGLREELGEDAEQAFLAALGDSGFTSIRGAAGDFELEAPRGAVEPSRETLFQTADDAAAPGEPRDFEAELLGATKERYNAHLNATRFQAAIAIVRESMERYGDAASAIHAIINGRNRLLGGGRMSADNAADYWSGTFAHGFYTELEKAGLIHFIKDRRADLDIAKDLRNLQMETPDPNGFSGNKQARQVAEIIEANLEMARKAFNLNGGAVRKLAGRMVGQTHDTLKMERATFKTWFDLVDPLMDYRRMDVDPADAGARAKFMKRAYDNLVSKVHDSGAPDDIRTMFKGPDNIAKRASQHRVLHFKDAASWMAYNREYGRTGLVETALSELDNIGRLTGLMQILGTNPQAMVDRLVKTAEIEMRDSGAKARQIEKLRSSTFSHGIDEVTGRANRVEPGDITNITAAAMSSLRWGQSTARLGAAVLSAPADIGNAGLVFARQGRAPIESMVMGFKALIKGGATRAGTSERELSDAMLVGIDGMSSDMLRYDFGGDYSKWQRRTMNWFFKFTLLTQWTNAVKRGFGLMFSYDLAKQARAGWDAMNPQFQSLLEQYGITRAEWETVADRGIVDVGGKEYVDPRRMIDMKDAASVGVGQKIGMMIREQAEFAAPTTGGRESALLRQGTLRGTLSGEGMRLITQFKGFPTTVMTRPVGQYVMGRGAHTWRQGLFDPSNATHLATYLGMATGLGALSLQLKEWSKGRENREFDEKFMIAALAQGGGLGIYGDFLFGRANRFGGGFLETALGPGIGTMSDGINIALKMRDGVFHGAFEGDRAEDDSPSYGEIIRYLKGNTPFVNVFYYRAVLDYLMLYQMQEMASPGYLRRMDRRLKRENDQRMLSGLPTPFGPSKTPTQAIPRGGGDRIFEGVRP